MVLALRPGEHAGMTKRLVALALWTYFAWYLGATLAALFDGPQVVGPIAAFLTAVIALIGWGRALSARPAMPRYTATDAIRR